MLRLEGPLRVFGFELLFHPKTCPLVRPLVTSHSLSCTFAMKAFCTSSRAPPASLESPQSKSSGLGPSFGGLTRRAMAQKTCYSLGFRVAKIRGSQPCFFSEHFFGSYNDLIATVCESLMPGKMSPHDWPALNSSVHDTQNFFEFRV